MYTNASFLAHLPVWSLLIKKLCAHSSHHNLEYEDCIPAIILDAFCSLPFSVFLLTEETTWWVLVDFWCDWSVAILFKWSWYHYYWKITAYCTIEPTLIFTIKSCTLFPWFVIWKLNYLSCPIILRYVFSQKIAYELALGLNSVPFKLKCYCKYF